MVWLILLVLLVAIFGIGTLLEAALWVLLLIAAALIALVVLAGRALL